MPAARCSLMLASLAGAVLFFLVSAGPARADDAVVATIKVTSATAGSSLGGRLVEGVMSFQNHDYLLTLRGVEEHARTTGAVRGLVRARDIEGIFTPSDQGLRSSSGVTIRFDPPLVLEQGKLEIELSSRLTPKISGGHRESGVE